MKKHILIAIGFLLCLAVNVRAQYTVTSIPYNPPVAYNTGTSADVHTDNIWSQVITLPFSFKFFGNYYTKLVIGSNELISFDTISNVPGSYCPWPLTSGTPLPTSTFPVCSIMGPGQDIDPTNMGSISWQVIGTSPNRMFIVSYDSVPYYGGTGSVSTANCPTPPIYATSQIVLYETTNIIDVYIQNKPDCSGWNGGLAIEGIQDSSGTNAAVVPGRNNTVWTTTNDAWRFSMGLSINIVNIVDADCGSNNGSITTNVINGTPPYTFQWNSTPPQTGQNLLNVPPGYYCVTVIDSAGDSASTCGIVDSTVYGAPEICMVSVDTASNHNKVIWEKPAAAYGIDKYYVYRESAVSGVYDSIGSQDYSVYSTFIDSSSNALIQSYRYELAIYDSCGNTSPLSNYHQTIHLSINAGMGGSWNLIWSDYVGFTFYTYKIFRGTNAGNLLVLDSVSSSVTSFTDLTPPSGILYYLVEAVRPTPCNPSKSEPGSSSPISNIANSVGTGITETGTDNGIQVYPNPATDNLIINVLDLRSTNIDIRIYDIIGNLVFEKSLNNNKTSIDVSSFSCGVYVVEVKTEKEATFKKFVKD